MRAADMGTATGHSQKADAVRPWRARNGQKKGKHLKGLRWPDAQVAKDVAGVVILSE